MLHNMLISIRNTPVFIVPEQSSMSSTENIMFVAEYSSYCDTEKNILSLKTSGMLFNSRFTVIDLHSFQDTVIACCMRSIL